MPKLNEDSKYKPNGIWELPFCKHCGKEAKKVYVLDGYDSGYETRCDCETVNLMVDNLQEQKELEYKLEQLKQEYSNLTRTYSEEYKKWYVRKALEDAAQTVRLNNFELNLGD